MGGIISGGALMNTGNPWGIMPFYEGVGTVAVGLIDVAGAFYDKDPTGPKIPTYFPPIPSFPNQQNERKEPVACIPAH